MVSGPPRSDDEYTINESTPRDIARIIKCGIPKRFRPTPLPHPPPPPPLPKSVSAPDINALTGYSII